MDNYCQCGCKGIISFTDSKGRARKYLSGHRNKTFKPYKVPTEKLCSKCNKLLKIECFSMRNFRNKSGLLYPIPRSSCKDCECKWAKENPPLSANRKEWRKQHYTKNISNKIRDCFHRWKRKTKDTDLSVDYLVNLWNEQEGKCYYTKLEMNWKASKIESLGFSLDRLNPIKGYVKGNVVFCCFFVNTMKGSLTEEEFYSILKDILLIKENRK